MVPGLSIVRHISGDQFEVTTFPGPVAEVFVCEPATGRCSCDKPDGAPYCIHLTDADNFLADHECPLCRNYSPFGDICTPCLWEVAVTMPQVVAA